MQKRTDWRTVIPEAAAIASSYDPPPTLRQVFYRLVAAGLIPNTVSAYTTLARKTAVGRRSGTFPLLTDGTRRIRLSPSFIDPEDALRRITDAYRLDRRIGQESVVWIVVEKATLETLALSVADPFGIPVVALRGYGSQAIMDRISLSMESDSRNVEILYIGDFDPTGEDIVRDLLNRLTVPVSLTRLAVTADQITEFGLVPMLGKSTDSRSAGFVARHGVLVQVEAEAIDPDVLEGMLAAAVNTLTDSEVLRSVLEAEAADRNRLELLL